MALALALIVPGAARGEDDADRLTAQLDRPLALQKLPAKSDDDPLGEVLCTYYPDLMLRESGTNTPDPNAATLLPLPAGAPRPRCDDAHAGREVTLKTEGFSFVGRKARFLLFSATDPNGAVPFMVVDAATGRVLYTDGTSADHGFQTVSVENDTLHLHYTRGFNASCSLLQDTAGCWSRLLAEGAIPADMAQPLPRRESCAAAYAAEQAPADDPSMVSYDIEVVIDATGRTQVPSHGALGCAPVP